MAGRILNRRELRQQSDAADANRESDDTASDDDAEVDAEGEGEGDAEEGEDGKPAKKAKGRAKAKAPKTPKVRKPRKVKAPPRQRVRWGVFDAGMKQVAIFDYSQRAAADEKLADLQSKKKGLHFMQLVKEIMPEPEPVPVAE
jgi:hypothetical protein